MLETPSDGPRDPCSGTTLNPISDFACQEKPGNFKWLKFRHSPEEPRLPRDARTTIPHTTAAGGRRGGGDLRCARGWGFPAGIGQRRGAAG